jgi:2'-5' RNA ligase
VHVTLAGYELASSDAMDQCLRAFCQRCPPPRLDIRSLGCFPSSGTIFAAPHTSAALLDLHARLIQAMKQEVLFAYHLAPGRWCPHVTLGTGLSVAELGRALVAAANDWDVCSGTATAIGVLAYPAEQDRAEFAFEA